MAANKNQHFVPQFYLKRFAAPNSKQIQLYNLAAEHYVSAASIKQQCSENYLYGKDLVAERLLGVLESMHRDFFAEIVGAGEISDKRWQTYYALITFAAIQSMRTPAKRAETIAVAKEWIRPVLEANGYGADALDRVDLTASHWGDAVFSALGLVPLAIDLKMKLIVNESEVDFVLSDNPIVIQNAFLAGRNRTEPSGFASIGIQIFFPLDARNAVIVYDPDIYTVGAVMKGAVHVRNKNDIRKLNELQILNAHVTVYFPSSYDEKSARELIGPLLKKRKPIIPLVTQFVEEGLGNRRFKKRVGGSLLIPGSLLLHSRIVVRHPNHRLSFVTICREAQRRKLDDRLAQLRSCTASDAHRAFLKVRGDDLRNGKISLGQFYDEGFGIVKNAIARDVESGIRGPVEFFEFAA